MTVRVLTTVIHHTLEIGVYVFFCLIEQHSKFLLHTVQVLYMCTLCDSTNINMVSVSDIKALKSLEPGQNIHQLSSWEVGGGLKLGVSE